ncbi:hypothetical protein FZEAL_7345 [Fusarium zealandicum]|uniref:Uncharacterized protein n=1 Tax=Fusarium zealandicum TaxID=1053134 RepID=A0A8H4UGK4_9HYPO|nr:hypothetical protein FZEAL_7345 [Fusarium zealandicum]
MGFHNHITTPFAWVLRRLGVFDHHPPAPEEQPGPQVDNWAKYTTDGYIYFYLAVGTVLVMVAVLICSAKRQVAGIRRMRREIAAEDLEDFVAEEELASD